MIKLGTASDEDWLHDSDLPNLQSLTSEVMGENAVIPEVHLQKKTSDGATIASDSPLYYSISHIDGEERKVFASE